MTSASIRWNADVGCDAVQYRINGGSWVGTSGLNYTVSGLTPNTNYSIQTRIKRTESQLWTESGILSFKTVNYARVLTANNFNSDASPYMTFSNASASAIDVYLEFAGTNIMRTNIPNTGSYTFILTTAERNLLYSKCPNAKTLAVRYGIATKVGGVQTYWHWVDKKMTVVGSNPTFSNFTYADTNSTTTTLTGSNQKIIKRYSNVKTTISSANKMVAQNSATAARYDVIAGTTSQVLYGTGDVNTTHNNFNSNTIRVEAIDSRANKTIVTKTPTIVPYTEVTAKTTIERKDGTGTTIVVNCNGTYFKDSFGSVTNSVDTIRLRLREKGGSYGSWTNVKSFFTLSNGTITANSVEITGTTYTLGIAYDVEIQFIDKLSTLTQTFTLGSGAIFLDFAKDSDGNLKGLGIGTMYSGTSMVRTANNKWFHNGLSVIDLNNSDIVGANAILMNDEADAQNEGILFLKQGATVGSTTTTDYETLRGYRGHLYYDNKNITGCAPVQLWNGTTTQGAEGNTITLSETMFNYKFLLIKIETLSTLAICPILTNITTIRGSNTYAGNNSMEIIAFRGTRNSSGTELTIDRTNQVSFAWSSNTIAGDGNGKGITEVWGIK